MNIKPGIQTTEFWQTLLVNLFGILALFGVHITGTGPSGNQDAITQAIALLASILASAWVTSAYTRGRSMLKVNAAKASQLPPSSPVEQSKPFGMSGSY